MRAFLFVISSVLISFVPNAFSAEKIDSFDWRQKLQAEFVGDLCEAGGYVQSCYEVSLEQCRSSATKNFDQCAKSSKLPAQIAPLGDSLTIAHNLGNCAGQKINKEFKAKKKSDNKCNQPDEWN